jgi:Family of unknown function (DUF6460)
MLSYTPSRADWLAFAPDRVVSEASVPDELRAVATRYPMNLRNFLGGSPIGVALRLAFLSVIVGLILSIFGITPRNFFYVLDHLARVIYDLGFGAVTWVFEYMVLGAMLVVPLWFVIRILRARPGNMDTRD